MTWQKINYQQLFNKEFMFNTLYNINKNFLRVLSANNNLPLRYTNFDRLKLYVKNGLKRLLSQRNLEHEVRTQTQGYMALELLNHTAKNFL